MENVQHFIGADLSKKTIDLAFHLTKLHLRIDNNSAGYNQLILWIKQHKLSLSQITVVMEHTGLYSYCFEKFLFKKAIRFFKVNALDIKLSIGITRGKSDKIDATRIALYGAQKADQLKVVTPTSKALERLKMLSTSRDKLVRTRAGLICSVKEFRNIGMNDKDPALHSQLTVITCLSKQIDLLEKEIQSIIRIENELHKSYQLLVSIKGVGPVVATNTIIKTYNFTRFRNARKFACFCGIAPFEHTSGTSIKGKTRINHLADKGMKTLFDLAAKSAIGCDPELKAFYERRLALGKSKMSTINIIRNKIVGRIFAVIKRQTPFNVNRMAAA